MIVDVSLLRRRREQVRGATESMLLEARAQGRTTLNEAEEIRYRNARTEMAELDEQIAEADCDLERRSQTQSNPILARLRGATPTTGAPP